MLSILTHPSLPACGEEGMHLGYKETESASCPMTGTHMRHGKGQNAVSVETIGAQYVG